MNGTHIGIILLLIINIIIVFVSIITNGILNRVYDDNQHLRHYVKELEERLNKVYDHQRMTNEMYNEYMNNKENWKNISKNMEEKDNLDDE